MIGRNLLEGRTGPVTQSVASVKSLLAYVGRGCDPLPEFVEMGKEEGRVVLVLSNKRDVYYTTTARVCSCPSAIYKHNGPCKHMRKFFLQITKPEAAKDEPLIERGGFKPFSLLPGEKAAQEA